MAKTIDSHVYQVEYIAENGDSKTEEIVIEEKNLPDKKVNLGNTKSEKI